MRFFLTILLCALVGCATSPTVKESLTTRSDAVAPAPSDKVVPWVIADTNGVIAWQVESSADFVTWTEVPPEWVGFDTRFQKSSAAKYFRLRGITE